MRWIIGNWKMNGSVKDLEAYLDDISAIQTHNKIILALPAPLLYQAKQYAPELFLAGQDCHQELEGAYTGSISASHLKDVGATYVIVGHSECRIYQKDTSEIVRKKAERALSLGLIPIICIGESRDDYENGRTQAILSEQMVQSFPSQGEYLIAYEPVWAIGTGLVPTSKEIEDVHVSIKQVQGQKPILYGGSVNAKNAHMILNLEHVDGVLVGGASLKATSFASIIQSYV